MKKSYIIYTCNSEKAIKRVLPFLVQNLNDENEQIVIIDDLSEDETIPLIVGYVGYNWENEDHYKLYINTKKEGKRKSIKKAKKIATGEEVVVIDMRRRLA